MPRQPAALEARLDVSLGLLHPPPGRHRLRQFGTPWRCPYAPGNHKTQCSNQQRLQPIVGSQKSIATIHSPAHGNARPSAAGYAPAIGLLKWSCTHGEFTTKHGQTAILIMTIRARRHPAGLSHKRQPSTNKTEIARSPADLLNCQENVMSRRRRPETTVGPHRSSSPLCQPKSAI
jgi:hypothetical protein